jgi:hypothetical protein
VSTAYDHGVALLLVIVWLVGFAFLGTGSGSNTTSDVPLVPQPKPLVKCSGRMTADQQQQHCHPPANP